MSLTDVTNPIKSGVCSVYKVPLLCGFDIIATLLAALGPVFLFNFTASPYDIKSFLMAVVGITIYTYLIIFFRCKEYKRIKQSVFSAIPWYIWAISLIVMSNISLDPTILIVKNLLAGPIGIILIGFLIYLPILQKFNSCF